MNLLVNAPTGVQEVIEVGEGGGYFDIARVVWDERTDGPLPSITLGGMVRSGSNLSYSQTRMDEHIAATKPPIPQEVTRRQARQALLLSGLLGSVQAAIDGIADPIQRGLAKIEWDDSQAFERNRPLLIALATALGLDSAELDQLFITASGL